VTVGAAKALLYCRAQAELPSACTVEKCDGLHVRLLAASRIAPSPVWIEHLRRADLPRPTSSAEYPRKNIEKPGKWRAMCHSGPCRQRGRMVIIWLCNLCSLSLSSPQHLREDLTGSRLIPLINVKQGNFSRSCARVWLASEKVSLDVG